MDGKSQLVLQNIIDTFDLMRTPQKQLHSAWDGIELLISPRTAEIQNDPSLPNPLSLVMESLKQLEQTVQKLQQTTKACLSPMDFAPNQYGHARQQLLEQLDAGVVFATGQSCLGRQECLHKQISGWKESITCTETRRELLELLANTQQATTSLQERFVEIEALLLALRNTVDGPDGFVCSGQQNNPPDFGTCQPC